MLMFDCTKLKEGRVLKGYTLQEVADQRQIDIHAYWRLEKGKTDLKVFHLLKLTDILDQPIEYFLTAQYTQEDFRKIICTLKFLHENTENNQLTDRRFNDGLELLEQSLSIN
ncbi:helix-turn-helix domain-containing protein [Alkalibacterium olivapovliticus]|uniref:HTH cro/C1-type domain-containing protein n=1 Tax=Alkalibacterium olivapovliticus TaxID=99907 RepID=A0A2T0W826_9LACT|nr:helix-turn-helix transcriptional regulator [Alkalibacterium olivapovliticus]PRY82877.1 hypothetical protein CLV38_10887 [Alkalibacterium olivapovliticus]